MIRNTLRARLIVGIVAWVAVVVSAVSGFFIYRFNSELEEQVARNTLRMREDLQQKGIALVRNIALVSERAIAGYDLSFLAEVVSATVGHDSGVVYVIIMDTHRRVLVSSNPAQVTQILNDADALFASQQDAVAAHDTTYRDVQITEVLSPLTVADKRWGVLRLGMSQRKLVDSIAATAAYGRAHNEQSVAMAVAVAAAALILGAAFATLFAKITAQPLADLTRGADQLRDGNTAVTLPTQGPVEFAHLAAAFNRMAAAIRERDATLRGNMRDLAAAKEAAEESNRLKSEFLANMSHELRTPLNAIVNVPATTIRDFETYPVWHCAGCNGVFQREKSAISETSETPETSAANATCPNCQHALQLKNKYFYVGDGDETVHFLKRMGQSANHLLALVNDVLSFSKLEAGKMQLFYNDIDTRTLLAELRNTVGPLAEDKHIALQLEASESAASLRADPVKTMQILINLVGNAIKFTPEQGSVTVTIRGAADSLRFAVQDTGIGIPQDKHELIFESFRQVDGSHTRLHQGSGLGLAICKQLVLLHGGQMGLQSAEGAGSTFFFTLPRHGANDDAHVGVLRVDDSSEDTEQSGRPT